MKGEFAGITTKIKRSIGYLRQTTKSLITLGPFTLVTWSIGNKENIY